MYSECIMCGESLGLSKSFNQPSITLDQPLIALPILREP